jgi:hypothetical protein
MAHAESKRENSRWFCQGNKNRKNSWYLNSKKAERRRESELITNNHITK